MYDSCDDHSSNITKILYIKCRLFDKLKHKLVSLVDWPKQAFEGNYCIADIQYYDANVRKQVLLSKILK